jgi:hypothetical protein
MGFLLNGKTNMLYKTIQNRMWLNKTNSDFSYEQDRSQLATATQNKTEQNRANEISLREPNRTQRAPNVKPAQE